MCELLHTRTPGIASRCFLAAACRGGGNSMNNLSQPPQPTEPDIAGLGLGGTSFGTSLVASPEFRIRASPELFTAGSESCLGPDGVRRRRRVRSSVFALLA